ncbi:hypothetical protein LOK49_LG05G00175 [Camellia lanceoleosa]|uniref:Uncharacterized protein n=1 Tax=Camellia lanceoleosa TaxID=1840588 RepID=A0ACC0HXE6_9ERIC|nr:hypothetical protein LOK49_LG05G00175 [Camellia lanceoleosa]
MIAGFIDHLVMFPVDTIKSRIQVIGSPSSHHPPSISTNPLTPFSSSKALPSFTMTSALSRTTVVMNAPFTAVHFMTYEAAKRSLMEVVSPESVREDENSIVHATTGICGCDRFSSSSIQDVQSIVKREGYGGLMRGWIPRICYSMHLQLQSADLPMRLQKPSFKKPMAATAQLTKVALKSFFISADTLDLEAIASPWLWSDDAYDKSIGIVDLFAQYL